MSTTSSSSTKKKMKPIDTFEKAWTLYQLGIPLHWGDFALLQKRGQASEFPPSYGEYVVKCNFEKFGLVVEVEETDESEICIPKDP